MSYEIIIELIVVIVLREKILKLVNEINELKLREELNKVPLLQQQYEAEKTRAECLEKELDEANGQKIEMEIELKSQSEAIYMMQIIFKEQYDELHNLKRNLNEESNKRKTKIINIIRKIDDLGF